MQGHIRKRGKNSWTIVVDVGRDPRTGKRKQHWQSIKGNKRDAEKALREVQNSLDSGTYTKPTKLTLGEFLSEWLKDYVWPYLRPRTAEGFDQIIRGHVIPSLGFIPIRELKPKDIQHYYSEKLSAGRRDGKGGLSPRTVSQHHRILHDALKSAVKWGIIVRNPVDAVEAPRFSKKEFEVLREHELNQVLDVAESTPYYAFFYLLLSTGTRRSEMLALRWQDVDFDFGNIRIVQVIHHLRDGSIALGEPKTPRGQRVIPLPPRAIGVLRQHFETQKALFALLGRTLEQADLVFTRLDGGLLLPNTVSHVWEKLVRKAGVPHVRLHDLRHTHASLMLKQGVHPKIVSERLGHSSVTITLDTYSHIMPGLQEQAAQQFDQWLGHEDTKQESNANG